MSKTRQKIRAEVNDYLNDEADVIWSESQKNLAINLAVRAAWPDLRETISEQGGSALTLTAATYIYTATSVTRAPWGVGQVYMETSGTGPWELLRSVEQKNDDGTWRLYLGKSRVDDNAGQELRIWFDRQYADLDSDATATELPPGYILYQSLFELCKMESMEGHHQDAGAFIANAPHFLELAERERVKHTRTPLVPYVGEIGAHGVDVYARMYGKAGRE